MNKRGNLESLSLVAYGSRRYFAVAVALLAVVPLLLVWYASASDLWSPTAVVPPWKTAAVLAGVSAFLALGIILLGRYTSNIARLKKSLDQIVAGEFPDSVSLFECADDMRAIEQSLNVIVGRLKERIETVEAEKDHLEKQLCQAQKLETLGILAAGITHEISAPVQFVRNNLAFISASVRHMTETSLRRADVAQTPDATQRHARLAGERSEPSVADEMREALLESEHGLAQIADIAVAMKNYLHPGEGSAKSPLDINSLLDETITLSRNEWKYVADMKRGFDADLPQVVCAAGDIRQALMNLIINAAAAIEERGEKGVRKGTITAKTALRDGYVEIRISDTGTGIPRDVRHKVFDRFFTTKQPGKGSGLGLSLAHTFIAKKHGGTLTFETVEGEGTTFIATLPVNGDPKREEGHLARECHAIPVVQDCVTCTGVSR